MTLLAGGAPIPPSALLTLSPNQPAPVQVEQVESLNVSAIGPNGVTIPSLPVRVTVTGVNPQTRPLTTDGAGQVGIAYASNPLVGVDQVQASAHLLSGIHASREE